MPNQPVRIFIVDAHPLVSEHLTGLLEQQPGWKVCGHAVDFENGLSGIRNLLPDLVLMEPSLRSEHGVDFIRALKGAHPNVLMVVFSMREEDQDVEQTLGAGAHGYVTKREPTAQVIAAIRHVMAGRIYISPKTVERRPDRAMRRTPVRSRS